MTDTLSPTFVLPRVSERGATLLAELLAVMVCPGDVVALEGEVGAGKTTFARAFIRALLEGNTEEIPSPTYTLVQTYETARMVVAHFDLYRLGDPSELVELGLDNALGEGVAIIEWPTHAGDQLPDTRVEIRLSNPQETDRNTGENVANDEDTRDVFVTGFGAWRERVARLHAMLVLLDKTGLRDRIQSISYLAGDASARRYARLHLDDTTRALVMDWPRVVDTKIVRSGKTYNELAHIADHVSAFVAVANTLHAHGFSAPEVLAHDLHNGIVILEDLGDLIYFDEVHKGASMSDLWKAATDTLVALRDVPVPTSISVSSACTHKIPCFDRGAICSEIELLVDWYWPYVHGDAIPDPARKRFLALWRDVIDRLLDEPLHWCLRDYHSPNLVWLPERDGVRKVGLIDFQDAVRGPAAYDVVSLLQDARVDVPHNLESQLIERYCCAVADADPDFDRARFMFSYAALGAQRNTKILGIFARLAKRDGKPNYLAHMPRIWGYLDRDLQHVGLSELANWYDEAFDRETCNRSGSA